MNFIRDIIGEKRQTGGQAGALRDDRADGAPAGAGAATPSPVQQTSPDRPVTPQRPERPALADRAPAVGRPVSEDRQPQPAADRDLHQQLRSIFLAEEKDRLPDSPATGPDPAEITATEPDHAPLRAAIARVEQTWCNDEALSADDLSAPWEDDAAQSEAPDLPEPAPAASEAVAEPVVTDRPEPAEPPSASSPETISVPAPAMGRGAARNGRVRTRLLGFNIDRDDDVDPIAGGQAAAPAAYTRFPLGWLIVTDGPGRGAAFTLFNGVSQIGRGKEQTVSLDFGDNSISRENHAAIAYDPMQNSFFIGHGGKANLVRRNDRPVLATEELGSGDRITIGETSLRFVALCGPDFNWQDADTGHWSDAAHG